MPRDPQVSGAGAGSRDVRRYAFPRRLTNLGFRVLALGLVLGLLGALTGSRILLGAGIFAVLLPFASMLTVPGQRVEVTADAPSRGRVAVPMSIRIRIRNTGRGVLPTLELRCVRPLFGAAEGAIDGLPPGAAAVWELSGAPTARGVSTHVHVEVAAPDLFGLSIQRLMVLIPGRVAVAPRAVPLPRPIVPAVDRTPLEPGDLRPWRPGDPSSAVAWRASARRAGPTARLVVRDRVPEETGVVRLALVGGPPEELERALEVLAAAALAVLAAGRRLELRIADRLLQPTRAQAVLDVLAELTSVPAAPNRSADLTICCRSTAASGGSRWIVDARGRVELT